jgi:hypothetical protein
MIYLNIISVAEDYKASKDGMINYWLIANDVRKCECEQTSISTFSWSKWCQNKPRYKYGTF